ncbi:MAG: hypothetical protein IKP28_03205 [Clostridia bacterium]|nr:hypothetical protein [Clostridia bacterium]
MFDILKYMDKTTVMKIPVEILETIKSKIDFNYKTNVNPNDLFNEKNISKEAMDILCYLDYTYWMSDDKKKEINTIIQNNTVQEELKKREQYSTEILFKGNNKNKINNSLIKVEKSSIFIRILNKIKTFFKR